MAVLTYHSAEDRVVKHWIRGHAEEEKREMGMAFGQANPERWVKALEEVVPSEEEISINPRARSARLRGAERLQEEKNESEPDSPDESGGRNPAGSFSLGSGFGDFPRGRVRLATRFEYSGGRRVEETGDSTGTSGGCFKIRPFAGGEVAFPRNLTERAEQMNLGLVSVSQLEIYEAPTRKNWQATDLAKEESR